MNRKFSHLEISNLDFAKEVSKIIKLDLPWEIISSNDGATSTFTRRLMLFSLQRK